MTPLFDPTTREFWTLRPEVYRTLRDDHPALHDTERDIWVLSRFDDVFRAANDPATFSSVANEADVLLPMLNYLDAPRHTELRRLVSRAFTPARVASLEPLVHRVVDQLIEPFVSNGGGDLISQFSAPLAATVIGKLIGIPEERIDAFRHLTDQFLVLGQTGGTDALHDIAVQIYALFGEIVAVRREHRADDLISALLDVQDAGGLSDEELLGFCFLLVGGGNDTTTNLIANGWVLLLRNPDQMKALSEDRSLVAPAVEEMLRLEPPAESHVRTTTTSVALHGVTIPPSSRVQLLWGAANRDDREFERPDDFLITRRAERHLSFGHGAHFCLGAALARIEARVALATLLETCSHAQLVEEPKRVLSPWACAYQRVDLTLDGGIR